MLKWTSLYIYSNSHADVYHLTWVFRSRTARSQHTYLKLWKMLPKSLSIKANWPFSPEGRGQPKDVCVCPVWDKIGRSRYSGAMGRWDGSSKRTVGISGSHRSWGQRWKRSLCAPDPESKGSAALRGWLMEQAVSLRSEFLCLNCCHATCHCLHFDQET